MTFDFSKSFARTLADFEALPAASKADHYRSRDHEKREAEHGETRKD